jgi:hypothetical protein
VKLARDQAEAKLDQRTRDTQKALEKAQAGGEVDAEVAAQLQRSLGNAAMAGMVKEGSDTATTSAEATLDEAREEQQEEDRDEELDAGEIEHVLPSFSTGGGGGGGGAPWAAARLFGGDDDAEADDARPTRASWRPMPIPPDPDEEVTLLVADADTPERAVLEASLAEAEARFGALPWAPGLLSRGLRHAGRCVGRAVLDEVGEADIIWSRARACLVFLSRHAPHPAAKALAEGAAGLGVAPNVSLVRALARELALVEAAIGPLHEGWAGVVDAAADARARPRVEHAAASVGPRWVSAPVLLAEALGGAGEAAAAAAEPAAAHPAAVAALVQAGGVVELPRVDPWRAGDSPPGVPDDPELAALDAVLEAETGGAPPAAPPLDPFFRQVEAGLTALGAVHVEAAAAALAAWPWLPDGVAEGVLTALDRDLRGVAQRVLAAGRAAEEAAAAGDTAAIEAASAEAAGILALGEFLRRDALAALAAPLLPAGSPVASTEPDPWPYRLAAGLAEQLRAELVEADGFFAFARRLALDGPVAAARGLVGGRGAAALLRAAALQSAGDDESAAIQLGVWLNRGGAGPYTVVWAAVEAAHALGDPALLEAAAPAVREAGDGGALNLLKAAWTEARMGASVTCDAGPDPAR